MSARIYKGFVVSKTGGPDAPWRAWRADGTKFRADTLAGLKWFVSEIVERDVAK